MRLLDPSQIPTQLWSNDLAIVSLPPNLAKAYVDHIESLGLRPLSSMREPGNPPIGGVTLESTNEHYAQSFDSSVARVQLAVLDPNSDLGDTSDTIIRMLAGDRVALVDAPCGAGAAAMAILCTIAELRQSAIFPRYPLDIHLIGAELSEPARQYAAQLVELVSAYLADQAIFISYEFVRWDVLCDISNTDLIQRIVRANVDSRPSCLVIANFSGFWKGNESDAKLCRI
jgi:hypothetical protein